MDIEQNMQTIAGNVCNLLVSINAAANFFLYCVLSDKYRKTVRELVTGYRYRHRHARNNISLYVPHTTTTVNGDGAHTPGGGSAGAGGYVGYRGANSRRCRNKALITWVTTDAHTHTPWHELAKAKDMLNTILLLCLYCSR